VSEFDLIPASYHARRRSRRVAGSTAVVYGLGLALAVAALLDLRADTDGLRRAAQRRLADRALVEQLEQVRLGAERERSARRAALDNLQALHRSAPLVPLFTLVERVLGPDEHLTRWHYADMPPTDGGEPAPTLVLVGTTRNHSSLAALAERAGALPDAGAVKVVQAVLAADGTTLEFELAVELPGVTGAAADG